MGLPPEVEEEEEEGEMQGDMYDTAFVQGIAGGTAFFWLWRSVWREDIQD